MSKNPVIRYRGHSVQVTPDTARELVDLGEAVLVSGKLPSRAKPAKDAPSVAPELAAKKTRHRKKTPAGEK